MYACSCRGVRAYVCVCVKRGMGGVIGEISNRQRTSPEDPARAVRGVGSSRRLDLSPESGRASSNGNHRSSDSERARGNRNDLRSLQENNCWHKHHPPRFSIGAEQEL